jgi:hypothetical protein
MVETVLDRAAGGITIQRNQRKRPVTPHKIKPQRPIEINVGAVKRLAKEKASYEAELAGP